MKRAALCVPLAIVLFACSSSDDASEACDDIAGNYTLTATLLNGTCPPGLFATPSQGTSITIAATGSNFTILLPSISGGCPATLNRDTCKLASSCILKDKDGVTIGTLSMDYTIKDGAVSGTTVAGLSPPAVTQNCSNTYRETGKKL